MDGLAQIVKSNEDSHYVQTKDGDLLLLDSEKKEFPQKIVNTSVVELTSTTDPEKLAVTTGLQYFIAFEFSLLPEVAYVYTALRDNDVYYVWIVVDEFSRAVREKAYQRQRSIIDEFPTFQFDFYIIGLSGQSIDDLIGDGSMHLTYERK